MRRGILIVLSSALVLAAAGCGSEGVVGPTPQTVIGTVAAAPTAPKTPAFKLKGNPVAGKAIFKSAGCTGCHTLKDAGATGTVGPNLDEKQPPKALVVDRVTHGKRAMPSFQGQLSASQIEAVATYVSSVAGK